MIAAPLIQVPPPGVFYTYFYNHTRRPRLEKLLYRYIGLCGSGSSNGFFNHFWIQVAVSLIKLKPPHGGFRSEMAVAKPFQN
jgi:hypothetical protein